MGLGEAEFFILHAEGGSEGFGGWARRGVGAARGKFVGGGREGFDEGGLLSELGGEAFAAEADVFEVFDGDDLLIVQRGEASEFGFGLLELHAERREGHALAHPIELEATRIESDALGGEHGFEVGAQELDLGAEDREGGGEDLRVGVLEVRDGLAGGDGLEERDVEREERAGMGGADLGGDGLGFGDECR